MISKILGGTIGLYLSRWRAINAADRGLAHKYIISKRHRNAVAKRKYIQMWKKFISSRNKARHTIEYFLNINNQALKKGPFAKWRRIIQEEDFTKAAIDKCLRMCLNQKLSYGLRKWKTNAKEAYSLECKRLNLLDRLTSRLKPNSSVVFKKWRKISKQEANQEHDRKMRGMLLVHRMMSFSERKHYARSAKMGIFTILRQDKALYNGKEERDKQKDKLGEVLLKQRMLRVWISNSIQAQRKSEKLKGVVNRVRGTVYRRTLKSWKGYIQEHKRSCTTEKEQLIELRLTNTELKLKEAIKERESENLRNHALIKLIDTLKGKVVQLSSIIRNRERRFQELAADNATLLGRRAEKNSKRLEKLKLTM